MLTGDVAYMPTLDAVPGHPVSDGACRVSLHRKLGGRAINQTGWAHADGSSCGSESAVPGRW